MASLYVKRGKIWISYYRLPGVRRRKSLDLEDTKAGWTEAERRKKIIESNLHLNPLFDSASNERNKLTLSELLDRFINNGKKRRFQTVRLYKFVFEKLKSFTDNIRINAIDVNLMLQFREEMIAKDKEQNTAIYMRHISAVFQWAVEAKLMPENPARKLKFKPIKKTVEIFTEKQLEDIWKVLPYEVALHAKFLLLTGFRVEESCMIKWSDIDWDNNIINHYNEKGNRNEPYPIYDELQELLESIPKDRVKPFHFIDPRAVSRLFSKGVSDAKVVGNLTMHNLKKTYVSRLIRSNKFSFSDVKYLAHHKNIQTTIDHYSWFDTGDMLKKMNSMNRRKAPQLKLSKAGKI